MALEPDASLTTLIAQLRRDMAFIEIRPSSKSGRYLEAVLRRSDLERCASLVGQVFGPPAKGFGQRAAFAPDTKPIVEALAGIRPEQCLYLKPGLDRSMLYAAFWPWGTDPQRITLKIGIYCGDGL